MPTIRRPAFDLGGPSSISPVDRSTYAARTQTDLRPRRPGPGRTLEVVVPATRYRDGLPESAHAAYDALLSAASTVDHLSYDESTAEAHMAASKAMLDNADRLFAVWDGEPARAYGGTADVVTEARQRGIPVTVIWPKGASRDQAA